MKKCNGTGLVLKICETKNNVWKKYRLSIQNSIDNHIKITYIKPIFASLSSGQKCRKPVFMQVSGICFTKWLYFGSICGRSNDEEFNCNKCKYHKNIKELYTFRREEM